MRVFIANFGKGNYSWEECKQRPSIATMNDADVQQFWLANDRASYVAFTTKHKMTAHGDPAPPQLASRWFNLMTIIAESSGDLWVHSDGEDIWWTVSSDQAAEIDEEPRAVPYQSQKVYECHKPCAPWSNRARNGHRLTWNSIHPKAKDFLTTESTLQELSSGYAGYVQALINGEDPDAWHSLPAWRDKLKLAKTQPVRNFSAVQMSIADMAMQAEKTARLANGQTVERLAKIKNFGFMDRYELERYLRDLLEAQESRCALSGLPLQFQSAHDDEQMLCSLDRIDSNSHYERGNLQIVCRFTNFWKKNMDDQEFKRLITVVKAG
jgi:hypothetical protein